jgi:hypothetical protein
VISFVSAVAAAAMVYFSTRHIAWELEDVETREELLGSAPILAGLAAGAVMAVVTIGSTVAAGTLFTKWLVHLLAGSLGTAWAFMFTIACAEIIVHEETGNDDWTPLLAEDVVQKLGLRGESA